VSQLTEKENVRRHLGLETDLSTVLVVGGGDGMGGIVGITEALATALGKSSDVVSYQMVVVCGSNEEAKQSLSGKEYGAGVKVSVEAYVNNMDEWMKAADALVTKAGPGTIAEASICGLPCMLFAYL
jgi:1,2-diacylglycerol 3-beta-galactosyltransferase